MEELLKTTWKIIMFIIFNDNICLPTEATDLTAESPKGWKGEGREAEAGSKGRGIEGEAWRRGQARKTETERPTFCGNNNNVVKTFYRFCDLLY